MKTILVDIDGILADLQGDWYPRYNAIRPEGYPELTPETVNNWDIPQAHHKTLWSVIEQPGLYRNLKPLEGAVEGLRELVGNRALDTYIVTSATAAPHTPTEKIQWLGEHFPFVSRKKIITCHNKTLIRGDVLVDDAPTNVQGWLSRNPSKTVVTINYPYNEGILVNDGVLIRAGDYTDTREAWENIVNYLRGY